MNGSNIDPRNSTHRSPFPGPYLLIVVLLVGFGLFIVLPKARTWFFDLDSVYAGGPGGNPELYDAADPIKFRIESGGQFEDLPRDPINHVAIIGDPRNDENMVIAGLHAAFLLFHNHAVDLIRTQYPGIPDNDAYLQAHRLTVWHYEWMILHEIGRAHV